MKPSTFRFISLAWVVLGLLTQSRLHSDDFLQDAHRVVFLGDSITYSGEYVAMFELAIRIAEPDRELEFLNLGLPSETLSGLSEPGHAQGRFPRPDLHERLERILVQTKPDLVIACYGMNCGIYHPYSDDRFKAFQEGVRRLHQKTSAAHARLVIVTPPVFDPIPLGERTLPLGQKAYPEPFRDYNQVLDLYSAWLMATQGEGWSVIDSHQPLNQFLHEQRQRDPSFSVAPDGVHLNQTGHWLVARELIKILNLERINIESTNVEDGFAGIGPIGGVLDKLQKRQRLVSDSWLTTIGHLRPELNSGMPWGKISLDVERLDREIIDSVKSLTPFPGTATDWHGFRRFDFPVNGKLATVVVPDQVAPGRPWVWHGEFFGHRPAPDIELLRRGFHIVYLSVPDLLGGPEAVSHWNALYAELTSKYSMAERVGLVGLSRGGLYCYNWAIANPDKVACIYGDAPVCDFKSWPGGKGKGQGSKRDWDLLLQVYGFANAEEAMAYGHNPIDDLKVLAENRVPLLNVFGDADEVVPWDENTGILATRYPFMGGEIKLIRKPGVGHHPHGLDDPTPIVEFLESHCLSGNKHP